MRTQQASRAPPTTQTKSKIDTNTKSRHVPKASFLWRKATLPRFVLPFSQVFCYTNCFFKMLTQMLDCLNKFPMIPHMCRVMSYESPMQIDTIFNFAQEITGTILTNACFLRVSGDAHRLWDCNSPEHHSQNFCRLWSHVGNLFGPLPFGAAKGAHRLDAAMDENCGVRACMVQKTIGCRSIGG